MEALDKKEKKIHHGYTIKRLRETLGMDEVAMASGMSMSEQAVLTYEQQSLLEEDILEKFAKVLNVSPNILRDFEIDPTSIVIKNYNIFEANKGHVSIGNFIQEDNSTHNYHYQEKMVGLFEEMIQGQKELAGLINKLLDEKNELDRVS